MFRVMVGRRGWIEYVLVGEDEWDMFRVRVNRRG
jgi:hypothetical protein